MINVGDEVIKFKLTGPATALTIPVGTTCVVKGIAGRVSDDIGLFIEGWPDYGLGHLASGFRKIQKRKTEWSIESFLTIKQGFEEPRRVKSPAKEHA